MASVISSDANILRYCVYILTVWKHYKHCLFFFNTSRFASQTLSSKSLVLVTVQLGESPKLGVSCEKMIIGSMLLAELKEALKDC